MNIHQIIKEKRKALSLTQEQVASYLGVSTPAVSKWENGSTYPDITLLPALARLLKTDLNTLLSFQEDLTDTEVADFVNELDRIIQEENYDTAFQIALDKFHAYPTCENLIYSVVFYLHGAMLLYNVQEQEVYTELLEPFYKDLSASENPEIREQAVTMLISYHEERGEFEKAEELIRALPSSSIDKEKRFAILYTRQKNYSEAVKLWEHQVLDCVSGFQTACLNLLEISLKENRIEDANFYADVFEQVSHLCYLAPWIPLIARLQLSIHEQDKEGCLSTLKELLSAMKKPWQPQKSPLYRHMKGNVSFLAEKLQSLLKEELQSGDDFSFLKDCEEYQRLLASL